MGKFTILSGQAVPEMKKKIARYVKVWESRGYPEGIPDEAPETLETQNKVPSYRSICKAIMKNDVALITLGYSRQPCAAYTELKRIELRRRGIATDHPQERNGWIY